MTPNRDAKGRFVSGNGVQVTVSVKDEVTGHLGGIKNAFRGLTGSIGGFNLGLGGMGGLLRQMVFQADGLVASFGAALHLFDGIGKAMTGELAELSASNSLAVVMKIDTTTAKKTVKDMMNTLSLDAASLPGSADDYISIAGQLSPVLGRIAANPEDFKKMTTDSARSVAILAEQSGADKSQAGMTASRLISGGSSFGALRRNDFLEKDPLLRDALIASYKKNGLSLSKANQDPKILFKAVTEAFDSIITPEYISALRNTAKAQLDSLKDSLFSSRSGLFGFLREIKVGDNKGRNGLQSVTDLLKAVTYMGETASKALAAMGLSFDPMDVIINTIDWFTSLANGLSGLLNGGDIANMGVFFQGITSNIGESLIRLTAFLGKMDGKPIADGINFILAQLRDIIKSVDWGLLGYNLGKILKDVIVNIDYHTLITLIWDGLKALGGAINEAMRGLSEKFFDFLKEGAKSSTGTGAIPYLKDTPAPSLPGSPPKDPNLTPGADLLGYSLPAIKSQGAYGSFAPVINITGSGGSPAETADAVMAAINAKYIDYRNGSLA